MTIALTISKVPIIVLIAIVVGTIIYLISKVEEE